jgi:hypothetical protein
MPSALPEFVPFISSSFDCFLYFANSLALNSFTNLTLLSCLTFLACKTAFSYLLMHSGQEKGNSAMFAMEEMSMFNFSKHLG